MKELPAMQQQQQRVPNIFLVDPQVRNTPKVTLAQKIALETAGIKVTIQVEETKQ